MEQLKFVNQGMDKKEAGEFIQRREDKFSSDMETLKKLEDVKTPEEIKLITLCNSLIKNELKELGIENQKQNITPQENIHFLSDENYKKFRGEKYTDREGATTSIEGHITFNKDKVSNHIRFASRLTHEMIHEATNKIAYLTTNGRKLSLGLERSTTTTTNTKYFSGINEIITEIISLELINKNLEEIKQISNSSESEKKDWETGISNNYFGYSNLKPNLDVIIQGIAKKNNISENETWEKIKKCYFSDPKWFFDTIEKTFGQSSLRVLASLNTNPIQDPKSNCQQVLNFFNTKDEKEKENWKNEAIRLKNIK